jgi:hypothetical protein
MLFTHLVDLRQRNEVLQHMSYEEIYRYVRRAAGSLCLLCGVTTAVGCCSDVRDAMTGSLEGPIVKQTVLADPGHYLH